jgi:hypothetical protein
MIGGQLFSDRFSRIIGWAKALAMPIRTANLSCAVPTHLATVSIYDAWARRTRDFDVWHSIACAFAHPTKISSSPASSA